MINSRKIGDLHPVVIKMCFEFIDECKAQGIDALITSTYRDNASQDALYAQGRTTPGVRVTNAKGGQSIHGYRLAFDFVPIVHGKCAWNDAALFKRCGDIGKQCGLSWSGDWTGKMREAAHLQYTGGLTLADLQSGKRLA